MGGYELNDIILYNISLCPYLFKLLCRETGLNCDYIIKGETEKDILKNGAEHAIQVHGMRAEGIYLNRIPANFLCQTIPKLHLVDQLRMSGISLALVAALVLIDRVDESIASSPLANSGLAASLGVIYLHFFLDRYDQHKKIKITITQYRPKHNKLKELLNVKMESHGFPRRKKWKV